MLATRAWIVRPIMGAIALLAAGAASAAVDKVICVPWQGSTSKPHTTISGTTAQLKCVVKTTDNSAIYYKWAYGDGTPDSAVTTLSGSTKYNVETTHVYAGATGTPLTAKLQVSNATPFVLAKEDPYLLKIEANDIDARINMAIDTGLWWLYKNGNTHGYSASAQTYDGSPRMTWATTQHGVPSLASPTASSVHAFGINGHKLNGDPNEDPYVEAVRGGMNYLVRGYYSNTGIPALQAVAIGPVNHGADGTHDPDGNSNGYGIQVYDVAQGNRTPYQGGQIMDAIVASGALPGDSTGRDFAPATPKSHTWTYGELLQDMADMYAWGQWDGTGCFAAQPGNNGTCGSWWYGWNYSSPGDNSASQWGAIGLLPAQESPWNVTVPAWVKAYNANWLAYSMGCTGPSSAAVTACTYRFFSYNAVGGCAGDSCLQTTPSGMTEMILDGQTTADLKWGYGQKYIADLWRNFTHAGSTWGGSKTYGWYSFAKAMRLAKPNAVTQLTKTSGRGFDWYYGNTDAAYTSCTTEANCEQGLAPRILEIQTTSGANMGSWQSGNLTDPPLTTAWMIITLRPTVFAAAPIACFNATPNPSFPDLPLNFDPSCSSHSETGKTIANLTKFEWDWDNNGVYDESSPTPSIATHAFPCAALPCAYPVKLRVTDDSTPALTATTVATINITEPPHPPVAKAGGPYVASMCVNDSLTLNGSASFDQDAGQHESGCPTCQNDGITAWDWDVADPVNFAAIDRSGAIVTLNGADVASLLSPPGSHNIGLRVTDNTALAYPSSGQPNLTNAAFDTVNVMSGCICNLAARVKLGKVGLTWGAVAGATSYDVYRSTSGPNTGFAKIATTTTGVHVDGSVTSGTKYYYRVIASTGCGSSAASALAP